MTPILIQCVVVLYKQIPEESTSLSTLLKLCELDTSISSRIKILICDNSPVTQEFNLVTQKAGHRVSIEYHHASDNPGLPKAYNDALSLAHSRGIPWLLLLDQDTCVTAQFFYALFEKIQNDEIGRYCAYVPQLIAQNLVLSPQVVGSILYRRIPLGFSGFLRDPIVAFNSAACIRVQDLLEIGGFPGEFWLDYLDHMVFHRLQQTGRRVCILNSQLEHSLSLQEIELNVSQERYRNILQAEWMFVRRSKWGGGVFVHRLRLLKRGLSHSIKLGNKNFSRQTIRAAFRGAE